MRETERRTDRHTDRQTDRQTDRDRQIELLLRTMKHVRIYEELELKQNVSVQLIVSKRRALCQSHLTYRSRVKETGLNFQIRIENSTQSVWNICQTNKKTKTHDPQ